MFLGIEIGGTKLQLGVGDGGSGQLTALERVDVVPERGAAGILLTSDFGSMRGMPAVSPMPPNSQ